MRFAVLLIVLSCSLFCHGETLEKLVQDGKLKLEFGIEGEQPYLLKEPVHIWVDIAYHRWFARGTSVTGFNAANLVVISESSFATNFSKSINGETWAIQRWSFTVYPLQTGDLAVPAIEVFISVNAENNVIVDGKLSLEPRSLNITEHESLKQLPQWLAAPEYSLSENWQGLKENYKAGDAVTRTIKQSVSDAPAMMLQPPLAESLPGVALYKEQPVVNDSRNRGELKGTRTDTFIYTIEESGYYTLPGYTFYWWDTASATLRTRELESLEINAEAPPAGARQERKKAAFVNYRWLLNLTTVAMLLAILVFIVRRRYLQKRSYTQIKEALFLRQLDQTRYGDALNTLYQLAFEYSKSPSLEKIIQADALEVLSELKQLSLNYSDNGTITQTQGKLLLRSLRSSKKPKAPWKKTIQFPLNPG